VPDKKIKKCAFRQTEVVADQRLTATPRDFCATNCPATCTERVRMPKTQLPIPNRFTLSAQTPTQDARRSCAPWAWGSMAHLLGIDGVESRTAIHYRLLSITMKYVSSPSAEKSAAGCASGVVAVAISLVAARTSGAGSNSTNIAK